MPPRRRRRRCRRCCALRPARWPRRCRAAARPSSVGRAAWPTVVLPDPGRPDEHHARAVRVRSPRAQRLGDRSRGSRVVAGGLGHRVAAELLHARLRPARARPSPRRRRRRPARRTRRSAGGSPWPARRRRRRPCRARAARCRSASSRRAPAARSPVDMPPSVPPARPVRRRMTPSASRSISSWAAEPRRAAVRKPSPTSTPLIAWMPISARGELGVEPAVPVHVRAEARRQAVGDAPRRPRRGCRRPCWAASTSATIAAEPGGVEGRAPGRRRARSTSSGVGSAASSATPAVPIATVCETSRMP